MKKETEQESNDKRERKEWLEPNVRRLKNEK
jgi:hypothetical protein